MKKRKKEKSEEVPLELFPEWEIPFESGPLEHYNYRCQECGYEEAVPAYIVDEMAEMAGLDFPEMPELECPRCPGGMVYCVEKV